MKRTILKFMHYCLSFLNFKPYFGKSMQQFTMSYVVSFDKTCVYDIGEDQSDINKLFGISYGFHHKQSDRIGWRYVGQIKGCDMVELLLYSYYGGVIKKIPITQIRIGDTVKVTLQLNKIWGYRYIDAMVGDTKVTTSLLHTPKKWGYTLGLYFGGNKRAPHTMSVRIQKLKEWFLKVG